MGSLSRALIAGFVFAAATAACSCGSSRTGRGAEQGSSASPFPSAACSDCPGSTAAIISAHPPGALRSPGVSLGPPVAATPGMPRIPLVDDNGTLVSPVAAYGDSWFVLSRRRPGTEAQATAYELWNAVTGERRAGWDSPEGKQDVTGAASGDWLVTVRMGMSLPFSDWQLILRNLDSGEALEIARSDPEVVNVPDLPVHLPTGFAPSPSVSGDRIVWSEFVTDGPGRARLRVQLFDLSSRATSTLTSVDPTREDVWQPSIGGTRTAWVHETVGSKQELVVTDLRSGGSRAYDVGGEIYSCVLSADGRNLAWDDNYVAKYVVDLDTGARLQYAGDEGWGTNRSGHFVSWQPSTVSYTDNPPIYNGAGGYYDFNKHEVRFIAHAADSEIVTATLMGNWFVWQDRGPTSDFFYFLRLE
jgi:hypothetical protein